MSFITLLKINISHEHHIECIHSVQLVQPVAQDYVEAVNNNGSAYD